jgi:hypothetical protein
MSEDKSVIKRIDEFLCPFGIPAENSAFLVHQSLLADAKACIEGLGVENQRLRNVLENIADMTCCENTREYVENEIEELNQQPKEK